MDLGSTGHHMELPQDRESHKSSIQAILFGDKSDLDTKWSPPKSQRSINMQRHRHVKSSYIKKHWREILCLTFLAAIGWFGIWIVVYLLIYARLSISGGEPNATMAMPGEASLPTLTPAHDEPLAFIVASGSQQQQGQQESASQVFSRANQDERWYDLVGLISRRNITTRQDLNDPTTNAYKALDWMIEYDQGTDMEIISSDTAGHFLEKYALIVLYFATHPSVATRAVTKESISSSTSTKLQQQHGNSLFWEEQRHDWIHQPQSSMCHWEGVGCGHLQNVVTLNISHAHLAGTLPRELVALQHLIELDMSFNNLGGTMPSDWVQAWPLISMINLSNNQLEGSVPKTWEKLWQDKSDLIINLRHNKNLEGVMN